VLCQHFPSQFCWPGLDLCQPTPTPVDTSQPSRNWYCSHYLPRSICILSYPISQHLSQFTTLFHVPMQVSQAVSLTCTRQLCNIKHSTVFLAAISTPVILHDTWEPASLVQQTGINRSSAIRVRSGPSLTPTLITENTLTIKGILPLASHKQKPQRSSLRTSSFENIP
jgi:hypothetical protein